MRREWADLEYRLEVLGQPQHRGHCLVIDPEQVDCPPAGEGGDGYFWPKLGYLHRIYREPASGCFIVVRPAPGTRGTYNFHSDRWERVR